MLIYFYTGENTQAKNWAKVFASKIVQIGSDLYIKIEIIGYSHCVHIWYKQKHIVEILANQLPEDILPKATKIELNPNKIVDNKYNSTQIWLTNYSIEATKSFCLKENLLSHVFDKDSITAISWQYEQDKLIWQTMHTYSEIDTIIYSQTEFHT